MSAPRAVETERTAGAEGTALGRLLEGTLASIPGPLHGPLSQLVGTAAFLAAPRARAAVRSNLAVIAPERAGAALARRAFVFQVWHYLGIFRLLRMDPAELMRSVDVVGWEHFERAHARGKGIVLGSAHLGPVSVCGQLVVARGYRITMPVEPETSEFTRAVNRARAVNGSRFISTESALGIHRVLRQGGLLGILADRAVTGVGERVPFFGRETLLPSAHVVLALRTGAPLLPGFAREERGRMRATFEPEVELDRTDDHASDVRAGVRRFAEIMERHIRSAPEQWSVFEPVWR